VTKRRARRRRAAVAADQPSDPRTSRPPQSTGHSVCALPRRTSRWQSPASPNTEHRSTCTSVRWTVVLRPLTPRRTARDCGESRLGCCDLALRCDGSTSAGRDRHGFLEISTHQPSRLVTAVTLGLQYPLESMALEECDGSHATSDRVDATARSVGWIALDYLGGVASGL
jgi:hypothetical protein